MRSVFFYLQQYFTYLLKSGTIYKIAAYKLPIKKNQELCTFNKVKLRSLL